MTQRLSIPLVLASVLAAHTAAAQSPPNASFFLLNKNTVAISRVFATPVGMPNWGQDRLANTPIPPGGNAPIRLPADGNCSYDIRVIYANGRNEERRGLNTCDVDNVTFPVARSNAPAARTQRQPEDDPSFTLVNRSRSPVNELYLSTTGDDSWGEDRLGDDTVAGGASKIIRLPPGECLYDLRVVFANGEANERRRLNLCQINNLRVP